MATKGDSATAGGSILRLQSNRAREAATPADLGIFRDSVPAQQLDTSSSSSMGPSRFGTVSCLVMRATIRTNSMLPYGIKGTAMRIKHIHGLSPYMRHFHPAKFWKWELCCPFTLNICIIILVTINFEVYMMHQNQTKEKTGLD